MLPCGNKYLGTSAKVGGIVYAPGPGSVAFLSGEFLPADPNPHLGPPKFPLVSYCPGPGACPDLRKSGLLLVPILNEMMGRVEKIRFFALYY